ncbi:MAG: hypothetical protein IKP66_01110 [Lachnospiraceae bacterium]|jgi:hypothetical protein|nr:hypothetical protein [Lachnospiraceae bacterium]
MARIGIFIPKYYRVGDKDILKAINETDIREVQLQVAKELTELCGGAICTEVTGYYEFADNYFSECPTLEIYALCKPSMVGQVADALKPIVTDIRFKLKQNSVGLYVNEDFLEL